MAGHIDILESQESLKRPLVLSLTLHGTVLLALILQGVVLNRPRALWGNPNGLGGGSVGITPVSQIPLPARGGPLNPLANDTQSAVPTPPPAKQKARRTAEPDQTAIPIKSKPKQPSRRETSTYRSPIEKTEAPNQIYSSDGRALSSPMVGQTGSGGVGMGRGGAFGNQFGYYRDLLEQAVARHWRTNDVNPALQNAPPVIVTFTLRRDGSSSDVRLEQSSGDKALDYSALRAIYEASPFPPLPAAYDRNDARIEFWFQLQR